MNIIFALLSFAALLTVNPILTFVSIVSLWFLCSFRAASYSSIFFKTLFVYQWLSINVPLLQATVEGVSLSYHLGINSGELAYIYSIIGLVCLSMGIQYGFHPHKEFIANSSHLFISKLRRSSQKTITLLVFISFALSYSVEQLALLVSPLKAFSFGVSLIVKFAGLILAAWALYEKVISLRRFLALFSIVLLPGFLGFFSGFKELIAVPIILGLFYWKNDIGYRFRISIFLLSLLFLLSYSLISWQAIKTDYRNFLNFGESSQFAQRSLLDRFNFLVDQMSSFDFAEQATTSLDTGLKRVGYLSYYAQVLAIVPYEKPHRGGSLTYAYFSNFLTPRLFFPDKRVIDDSEHTNKYALDRVSGLDSGTSISLGYMADSYIDYGIFSPIFIFFLGYIWSKIWIGYLKAFPALLSLPLACAFVFPQLGYFGTSLAKIIGFLMIAFLIRIVSMKIFNLFPLKSLS